MKYMLAIAAGALGALGGLALVIYLKRRVKVGQFILVFSTSDQQVLRTSLTREGAVWLVLTPEGKAAYVESGANPLDSMKRKLKVVLLEGAYLQFLANEIAHGRKIRVQVMGQHLSEKERKAAVRDLIISLRDKGGPLNVDEDRK